ncbi:hypothetical protein MXB_4531 [Myxobolus squamalis]|nr:hypothetical protein MXB_4531 [Myxobolus squamalis]
MTLIILLCSIELDPNVVIESNFNQNKHLFKVLFYSDIRIMKYYCAKIYFLDNYGTHFQYFRIFHSKLVINLTYYFKCLKNQAMVDNKDKLIIDIISE